jgi:rSAM/selenodomain-associated transferase 2
MSTSSSPPLISIVIPVYHEHRIINQTLTHLYQIPLIESCEIIIVDGAPDHNTLAAISYSRVIKTSAPKGRGIQMNQGIRNAAGRIVLFLHADTLLPQDALKQVLIATQIKGVVGGAFDLGIDSQKTRFRIIETVASYRSRFTRVPYGDQAIFIRRSYLNKIGCFQNIPLMEDVELMRRIKRLGGKIRIISSKVRTSPRRWQKEGLFFCSLRNWLLIILYSWGVPPERLVRFYYK